MQSCLQWGHQFSTYWQICKYVYLSVARFTTQTLAHIISGDYVSQQYLVPSKTSGWRFHACLYQPWEQHQWRLQETWSNRQRKMVLWWRLFYWRELFVSSLLNDTFSRSHILDSWKLTHLCLMQVPRGHQVLHCLWWCRGLSSCHRHGIYTIYSQQ